MVSQVPSSSSFQQANRMSTSLGGEVVINQTASFSIGRKKAFSDICFVGLNLPRIEAEDAFFHSRDEATSGTSPDIATDLKITPPIFLVDRKQSDGGTRVRVAPCFPDGDSPRMFFEKKHGTRFSAAAFSQNGLFGVAVTKRNTILFWPTRSFLSPSSPSHPSQTCSLPLFSSSLSSTVAVPQQLKAREITKLAIADDASSLLLFTNTGIWVWHRLRVAEAKEGIFKKGEWRVLRKSATPFCRVYHSEANVGSAALDVHYFDDAISGNGWRITSVFTSNKEGSPRSTAEAVTVSVRDVVVRFEKFTPSHLSFMAADPLFTTTPPPYADGFVLVQYHHAPLIHPLGPSAGQHSAEGVVSRVLAKWNKPATSLLLVIQAHVAGVSSQQPQVVYSEAFQITVTPTASRQILVGGAWSPSRSSSSKLASVRPLSRHCNTASSSHASLSKYNKTHRTSITSSAAPRTACMARPESFSEPAHDQESKTSKYRPFGLTLEPGKDYTAIRLSISKNMSSSKTITPPLITNVKWMDSHVILLTKTCLLGVWSGFSSSAASITFFGQPSASSSAANWLPLLPRLVPSSPVEVSSKSMPDPVLAIHPVLPLVAICLQKKVLILKILHSPPTESIKQVGSVGAFHPFGANALAFLSRQHCGSEGAKSVETQQALRIYKRWIDSISENHETPRTCTSQDTNPIPPKCASTASLMSSLSSLVSSHVSREATEADSIRESQSSSLSNNSLQLSFLRFPVAILSLFLHQRHSLPWICRCPCALFHLLELMEVVVLATANGLHAVDKMSRYADGCAAALKAVCFKMLYQSGSALPTIISTPNWKNVDLAPAPAQLPSKIRGRGIRRVSSALPNPFKFRGYIDSWESVEVGSNTQAFKEHCKRQVDQVLSIGFHLDSVNKRDQQASNGTSDEPAAEGKLQDLQRLARAKVQENSLSNCASPEELFEVTENVVQSLLRQHIPTQSQLANDVKRVFNVVETIRVCLLSQATVLPNSNLPWHKQDGRPTCRKSNTSKKVASEIGILSTSVALLYASDLSKELFWAVFDEQTVPMIQNFDEKGLFSYLHIDARKMHISKHTSLQVLIRRRTALMAGWEWMRRLIRGIRELPFDFYSTLLGDSKLPDFPSPKSDVSLNSDSLQNILLPCPAFLAPLSPCSPLAPLFPADSHLNRSTALASPTFEASKDPALGQVEKLIDRLHKLYSLIAASRPSGLKRHSAVSKHPSKAVSVDGLELGIHLDQDSMLSDQLQRMKRLCHRICYCLLTKHSLSVALSQVGQKISLSNKQACVQDPSHAAEIMSELWLQRAARWAARLYRAKRLLSPDNNLALGHGLPVRYLNEQSLSLFSSSTKFSSKPRQQLSSKEYAQPSSLACLELEDSIDSPTKNDFSLQSLVLSILNSVSLAGYEDEGAVAKSRLDGKLLVASILSQKGLLGKDALVRPLLGRRQRLEEKVLEQTMKEVYHRARLTEQENGTDIQKLLTQGKKDEDTNVETTRRLFEEEDVEDRSNFLSRMDDSFELCYQALNRNAASRNSLGTQSYSAIADVCSSLQNCALKMLQAPSSSDPLKRNLDEVLDATGVILLTKDSEPMLPAAKKKDRRRRKRRQKRAQTPTLEEEQSSVMAAVLLENSRSVPPSSLKFPAEPLVNMMSTSKIDQDEMLSLMQNALSDSIQPGSNRTSPLPSPFKPLPPPPAPPPPPPPPPPPEPQSGSGSLSVSVETSSEFGGLLAYQKRVKLEKQSAVEGRKVCTVDRKPQIQDACPDKIVLGPGFAALVQSWPSDVNKCSSTANSLSSSASLAASQKLKALKADKEASTAWKELEEAVNNASPGPKNEQDSKFLFSPPLESSPSPFKAPLHIKKDLSVESNFAARKSFADNVKLSDREKEDQREQRRQKWRKQDEERMEERRKEAACDWEDARWRRRRKTEMLRQQAFEAKLREQQAAADEWVEFARVTQKGTDSERPSQQGSQFPRPLLLQPAAAPRVPYLMPPGEKEATDDAVTAASGGWSRRRGLRAFGIQPLILSNADKSERPRSRPDPNRSRKYRLGVDLQGAEVPLANHGGKAHQSMDDDSENAVLSWSSDSSTFSADRNNTIQTSAGNNDSAASNAGLPAWVLPLASAEETKPVHSPANKSEMQIVNLFDSSREPRDIPSILAAAESNPFIEGSARKGFAAKPVPASPLLFVPLDPLRSGGKSNESKFEEGLFERSGGWEGKAYRTGAVGSGFTRRVRAGKAKELIFLPNPTFKPEAPTEEENLKPWLLTLPEVERTWKRIRELTKTHTVQVREGMAVSAAASKRFELAAKQAAAEELEASRNIKELQNAETQRFEAWRKEHSQNIQEVPMNEEKGCESVLQSFDAVDDGLRTSDNDFRTSVHPTDRQPAFVNGAEPLPLPIVESPQHLELNAIETGSELPNADDFEQDVSSQEAQAPKESASKQGGYAKRVNEIFLRDAKNKTWESGAKNSLFFTIQMATLSISMYEQESESFVQSIIADIARVARIDTFSTTLHRAREAGPSDQVPYEGTVVMGEIMDMTQQRYNLALESLLEAPSKTGLFQHPKFDPPNTKVWIAVELKQWIGKPVALNRLQEELTNISSRYEENSAIEKNDQTSRIIEETRTWQTKSKRTVNAIESWLGRVKSEVCQTDKSDEKDIKSKSLAGSAAQDQNGDELNRIQHLVDPGYEQQQKKQQHEQDERNRSRWAIELVHRKELRTRDELLMSSHPEDALKAQSLIAADESSARVTTTPNQEVFIETTHPQSLIHPTLERVVPLFFPQRKQSVNQKAFFGSRRAKADAAALTPNANHLQSSSEQQPHTSGAGEFGGTSGLLEVELDEVVRGIMQEHIDESLVPEFATGPRAAALFLMDPTQFTSEVKRFSRGVKETAILQGSGVEQQAIGSIREEANAPEQREDRQDERGEPVQGAVAAINKMAKFLPNNVKINMEDVRKRANLEEHDSFSAQENFPLGVQSQGEAETEVEGKEDALSKLTRQTRAKAPQDRALRDELDEYSEQILIVQHSISRLTRDMERQRVRREEEAGGGGAAKKRKRRGYKLQGLSRDGHDSLSGSISMSMLHESDVVDNSKEPHVEALGDGVDEDSNEVSYIHGDLPEALELTARFARLSNLSPKSSPPPEEKLSLDCGVTSNLHLTMPPSLRLLDGKPQTPPPKSNAKQGPLPTPLNLRNPQLSFRPVSRSSMFRSPMTAGTGARVSSPNTSPPSLISKSRQENKAVDAKSSGVVDPGTPTTSLADVLDFIARPSSSTSKIAMVANEATRVATRDQSAFDVDAYLHSLEEALALQRSEDNWKVSLVPPGAVPLPRSQFPSRDESRDASHNESESSNARGILSKLDPVLASIGQRSIAAPQLAQAPAEEESKWVV